MWIRAKLSLKEMAFLLKKLIVVAFFYKKNIFLNAPIYCLPDIQKSNKTYVTRFKKR